MRRQQHHGFAIDQRHGEVEQDHVDLKIPQNGERTFAVGGDQHAHAVPLHELGQHADDGLIVVNNQTRLHHLMKWKACCSQIRMVVVTAPVTMAMGADTAFSLNLAMNCCRSFAPSNGLFDVSRTKPVDLQPERGMCCADPRTRTPIKVTLCGRSRRKVCKF